MKKLAYLAGVVCLAGALYSCDDTPKNPGDFSMEAELALGSHFRSRVNPESPYELTVASRRDTVYARIHKINDTVFEYTPDGDSTYVFGPDGKPLVNVRDTVVYSKKRAKLIEMEPVVINTNSDTLEMEIFSNARWTAKQPKTSTNWIANFDGTESGGGNSNFGLTVGRNRSKMRVVIQEFFTSDSMTCIVLPIHQRGERD